MDMSLYKKGTQILYKNGRCVNLKRKDAAKREYDYINHGSKYKLYVSELLKVNSCVLLPVGHSPDQ